MHMFVHNFSKRCIIIGYCLNKPSVLGINLRCIVIFLHKIERIPTIIFSVICAEAFKTLSINGLSEI